MLWISQHMMQQTSHRAVVKESATAAMHLYCIDGCFRLSFRKGFHDAQGCRAQAPRIDMELFFRFKGHEGSGHRGTFIRCTLANLAHDLLIAAEIGALVRVSRGGLRRLI